MYKIKKVFVLSFVLAVALFMVTPAQAAFQDMWAQVYKWTGNVNSDGSMQLTKVTSGITFKVLAKDSDTKETTYVYGSNAYTSLTNPVTTTNFASATVCNSLVKFRVDPTDSTTDRYVDLIVVDTNGGFTRFVENFDKYTHGIVIDERPNVIHQGTIWYDHTTTGEVDTGIDFLYDTLVSDVRVETVTGFSGVTINVGLIYSESGGDVDGFRKSVSLATAGFTTDTGVITSGTSNDYVAVSTYGALLYTAVTGTGAAYTTKISNGGRSYLGHVVTASNAKSLTYTVSSADGASYGGYIHYWFNRIR